MSPSNGVSPSEVHLAHQWWVSRRGGERLFEEIASLFPDAAISTFFLRRETLSPAMRDRDWRVSPLGLVAPRFIDHRKLLPLYPWAVRRLRVPEGTKLLLTSDAALIKGIPKPPGCVHVCYCNSPPRYLWDLVNDYMQRTGGIGPFGRKFFCHFVNRLRAFDLTAAAGVDHFIANSAFIAERIRRIYGRDSVVVHPAVDVDRFTPSNNQGDFFLVVSELVSYKRVDLAIDACCQVGRKLVVVGDGPEAKHLRKRAANSDVVFLGRAPDAEVAKLMAECRAFIHPQIEDFGISAVEAQAAGRPVIAFRAGGALETVIEGKTGLFFNEQTPGSLGAALLEYEARADEVVSAACRGNAARFAPNHFRAAMLEALTHLSGLKSFVAQIRNSGRTV